MKTAISFRALWLSEKAFYDPTFLENNFLVFNLHATYIGTSSGFDLTIFGAGDIILRECKKVLYIYSLKAKDNTSLNIW